LRSRARESAWISQVRELDARTEILLHGFFRLDMVLFKLVAEFLESFKVFNGDPHFLDFLEEREFLESYKYDHGPCLAQHEIPLCELDEHFFGTECVV